MTPHDFVTHLLVHYSKRHPSDAAEAIWLKDIMAEFANTDHAVLDKAYDLIRGEFDERAFPLPATLRKFIIRAAEIVYPERERVSALQRAEDVSRRHAWAESLMHGEIGIRAAKDGWCIGLRDFISAKGRLPKSYEIGDIIANSRFIERYAAGAEPAGAAILAPSFKTLALSFLAKRERLAVKLLSEPDENGEIHS